MIRPFALRAGAVVYTGSPFALRRSVMRDFAVSVAYVSGRGKAVRHR
jgi:hypothetical protein